jgi:hypothetical protein
MFQNVCVETKDNFLEVEKQPNAYFSFGSFRQSFPDKVFSTNLPPPGVLGENCPKRPSGSISLFSTNLNLWKS